MAARHIEPLYENEADLGPKMRALTVLQRNFVLCMSKRATQNASAALRQAGWSGKSEGALRVDAHRLAHDERIQEALLEESRRRVKAFVPAALEELGALLDNPQVDPAVRLKAIITVLDRAGIHLVSESKLTVENRDISQDTNLLGRIETLAVGLGIDARLLLGSRLAARKRKAAT